MRRNENVERERARETKVACRCRKRLRVSGGLETTGTSLGACLACLRERLCGRPEAAIGGPDVTALGPLSLRVSPPWTADSTENNNSSLFSSVDTRQPVSVTPLFAGVFISSVVTAESAAGSHEGLTTPIKSHIATNLLQRIPKHGDYQGSLFWAGSASPGQSELVAVVFSMIDH